MPGSLDSSSRWLDGRIVAICLAFLCAALIAAGALMEHQPIVAAVAVLTVPAAVFFIVRPESAVPLALFVMCQVGTAVSKGSR